MNRISYDLSGTTTVITGGSSGIGLATAELIARSGGDVIVSASRKSDKTEQALGRIREASQLSHRIDEAMIEALPYEADNEDSVREFFTKIAGYGRRIDYIVHSAGISPDEDYDMQNAALWNKVLSVNTIGTALVAKHASDIMRHQEIIDEVRGKIVLVTSTNGIDSYGIFSAPYDASKAATNNMVRNIGEYFHREFQIVVNGLAPGWIDTELNDTLPPEARAEESAKIWAGRFARSDEMASHAVSLLLIPYMSGRIIMADGGYR